MAATDTIEFTMGEKLAAYRRRQRLPIDQAAALAQEVLPLSLSMSRELLRRIEAGLITEAKVNPVHVAALAKVYGVRVSDISPSIADDLGVVDLLIDSTG